MLTKNEVKTVK